MSQKAKIIPPVLKDNSTTAGCFIIGNQDTLMLKHVEDRSEQSFDEQDSIVGCPRFFL